jgi:(p)ppGpp synthase/HD superfamily hydrolase
VFFSPVIDLALKVAVVAHATQVRKGTSLPYIAHPVHVARLLEHAGLPDHVVVAGFLHDVLEDLEPGDEATRARFLIVFPPLAAAVRDGNAFREALRAFLGERFGEPVMTLVDAVTEQKESEGRPRPWIDRRRDAIAHLRDAHLDVIALKAADVLHNVRSVVHDLRSEGASVMSRFNASAADTLWYYASVADICRERLEGPARQLAEELHAAVDDLASELRLSRPRTRNS